MTDDTMMNIFKDQLDNNLGITKYNQGLKKKIGMARGVALTTDADKYLTTEMKEVLTNGAKYLKELKDGGFAPEKAKKEANKYTKSLKNYALKVAEAKFPGYEEAADIELRKKAGIQGVIKEKPLSKKSTKKTTKKKEKKEKKEKKK